METWKFFDTEIQWFTDAPLTQTPEKIVVLQLTKVSNVLLLHSFVLSDASSFLGSSSINHHLSSDPMRKASIP